MEVSDTGYGLTILIETQQVPHHDWMSYVCWYSLTKNLPDAKVVVTCARANNSFNLMRWTYSCRVPLLFHKNLPWLEQQSLVESRKKHNFYPNFLSIIPEMVCVRDFQEGEFKYNILQKNNYYKNLDSLFCDCRSENPTVFVTYDEGWGKFVTSSWIHKLSCPISVNVSYVQPNMTVNETKLGRIWDSASRTYQSVSRG
jgi:hypothetical protein